MCHRFHTCINVMFVPLQLTQQADQLAAMLSQARETTTDSSDAVRRALADLVYHECGRMDEDTFDEFQHQCFNLICHYKVVARQKREGAQSLQQYPSMWQPPPFYPRQPQYPSSSFVVQPLVQPQHSVVTQSFIGQLQSSTSGTYSTAPAVVIQADSAAEGSTRNVIARLSA